MNIITKAQVQDAFVFEFNDTKILYSPLDRIVLRLSPHGYKCLLEERSEIQWRKIVDPEEELGLFSGLLPENVEYVSENGFDGLVFLITSACNMSCKYCYAKKSQQVSGSLSRSLGKNVLNYFFSNIDNACESIGLAFHGYGECSLFSDKIVQITKEFKKNAQGKGKQYSFQITTNGTFSSSFCEFLLENNFFVNLSLDGPPGINDIMRQTREGDGSYELVRENVLRLTKVTDSPNLMIRATFVPETISQIIVSFEHFHDLGVRLVHMEPVYTRGAAETMKVDPTELLSEFADQYRQCVIKANEWGMKIYYGPINFGLGVRFCSHRGKLMVDYAGRIVACVEAGPNSGLDQFYYGKISDNGVSYNPEKIKNLNGKTVTDYARCQGCLLKYHCAGNCLVAKVLGGWDKKTEEATCIASEEIFAWVLKRIVDGESVDSILDFPLHRVW